MQFSHIKKFLGQLSKLVSKGSKGSQPEEKQDLIEINILPLKDIILFPGGILPLQIIETQHEEMTHDNLNRDIPLVMLPLAPNQSLEPGMICGGGKVRFLDKDEKGTNIVVEGESRYRIHEVLQLTPFAKGLAEKVDEIHIPNHQKEKFLYEKLRKNVQRWIFSNPSLDDSLLESIGIFHKSHLLADFLGNHFFPTMQEKQRLLEESSREKRVDIVNDFLNKEIDRFAHMYQNSSHFYTDLPKSRLH